MNAQPLNAHRQDEDSLVAEARASIARGTDKKKALDDLFLKLPSGPDQREQFSRLASKLNQPDVKPTAPEPVPAVANGHNKRGAVRAAISTQNTFGQPLTPSDLRLLADRWITPEIAEAAGISRVDSFQGQELVGRKRGDLAGLAIPYYWPGESHPRQYQLRPDRPDYEIDPTSPKGVKAKAKYIWPTGCPKLVYTPRGITPDHLRNIDLPLIITEGEFKTLALHRAASSKGGLEFLAIGLGGVWNWRGTIGKTQDSNGQTVDVKGVLPQLQAIAWDGRKVFIAYDSDAVQKPDVKTARHQLSRHLRGCGASVATIEWTEKDGKGIDDFLAAKGADAFFRLIAAARLELGSWKAQLLCSDSGKPKSVLANACIALRQAPEWAGVLSHDDFALTVNSHSPPWNPSQEPTSWTDNDTRLTAEWLQTNGIEVTENVAHSAILTVAFENRFHPVRDYLNGLEWDREKRVETWLSTYLGVADTPYAQAVGRCWLTAAVARIFQPGAKVDNLLLLEGPQGIRKSSALRVLGGKWFTDELGGEVGTKDAAIQIVGRWIIEISELDSLSRADVGRTKAFLSRSTDRFRPPYGRIALDVDRSCVFAGSTNESEYLRDATGGRRFWPVRCSNIDLEALRKYRDQLWAEAVHLFLSGQPWWLDSVELEELAAEQAEGRYEEDSWSSVVRRQIRTALENATDDCDTHAGCERCSVTIEQVLREGLKKELGSWTPADTKRVATILQCAGWERFKSGPRQKREWRYRETAKAKQLRLKNS